MAESNILEMRGFMICLHQMNDFLPWCGPGIPAVEMIIREMKEAGLNTLLFEYETFFPWQGREKQISASNAFSPEEIRQINECALTNGVEIIPLVQVFGHMYHVLIHEQYRDCAESSDAPQQLCPLAAESFELAKKLIDDTLALHPHSRYIHLGGDECGQLGSCPDCAAFVRRYGTGKLYSSYMTKVTQYALDKGVIPILWHDIALAYPESLTDFDSRVIFQFWNYGDASHGSVSLPLQKLLNVIPACRIIGSPGARAEMQHGAIHHSLSLIESNISEIASEMKRIGAVGTVLTDWPDTGCSFFDAFYAMRFQGYIAAGGDDIDDFRINYARNVFGADIPGLPDKLDSIAGFCTVAPGFQYRKAQSLNRYSRRPYDFSEICSNIRRDYDLADGENELYRLIGKRFAAVSLLRVLKKHLPAVSKNHTEYQWYILLAEMTILFFGIEIGLRKFLFVKKYFPEVTPELLEQFQSRTYLQNALDDFDRVKELYRQLHVRWAAELNAENCTQEMFPAALKEGIAGILSDPGSFFAG
ncbi:MAG: family 20 glycosylhydrolase [Lentisphaeria bacterium]|nr:family 20 glycosylhydrolase [Lentisphaeria bacterium]